MDPITVAVGTANAISAIAGGISSLKSLFSKKPKPVDPVVALRPFFEAISAQLNELKQQNAQIITRLDKLPEIIQIIVRNELRDSQLEEAYSELRSAYNLYFSELNNSDQDWTLTIEGAQIISAPLHRLYSLEYRLSKIYELVQFTFFADVAWKEGGRSVWRLLLSEKITQQGLPFQALVEKYDSIISELRSALSSPLVTSHTLAAYPGAPLAYSMADHRRKIVSVHIGFDRVPIERENCCKVHYTSVPKYENRTVDDQEFNTLVDLQRAKIDRLLERESDAAVELREMATAIEFLNWALAYFALPKNTHEQDLIVSEISDKDKIHIAPSIAFSPRATSCYGA